MHPQITTKLKISLLILSAMGMMSGIAIVASLPLISHHFSDVKNIDFLSKLLLTVPSIMVALFAPFFGHLADKIGRLKPLYFGIFLFILSGSSGLYLEDFYHVLIGRAFLGISVALVMTSSMALIGDYFDEEARHKFISLQGMVVGLSGIIFIISGGYLAHLGWRYPFLIYALPLLLLPLLFSSLKEPVAIVRKEEEDDNGFKKLLPVYLTGFFSMVLFYMLPTQIPYLVINELGGTPSSVSYFIAFSMLVNAITAKQYHHIKKRFGFTQLFVIIYLFFGTGLFIISQVQSVSGLFGASVFIGVGFGLLLVNVNMWLLSLVAAHKGGRAVGLLTSAFYLGQFISPILFEPIVQYAGIRGLFFIVSLFVFLVAFVIFTKGLLKSRA